MNQGIRFFCVVFLAVICSATLQQVGKNIRAIEEIKNEISEMKSQIKALESYPIGYSEPLSWYPATDPAGPDEQPTIEQPEIVHQTTNTIELQERIADPYIQAIHGGK